MTGRKRRGAPSWPPSRSDVYSPKDVAALWNRLRLLTPADVAREAGVSSEAVRKWRLRKQLSGDVFIESTGLWLYSAAHVRAFLAERKKKAAAQAKAGKQKPRRRGTPR